MVKVLNPLGGTEAHGTASGITWRVRRATQVVHARGVPSRRRSASQYNVNTHMLAAGAAWKALPAATRDLWRTRAEPHGTGFSTFCRYKLNLLFAGYSSDPPLQCLSVSTGPPELWSQFDSDFDTLTLNWDVWASHPELQVMIYWHERTSIAQSGDIKHKIWNYAASYDDGLYTADGIDFMYRMPAFFVRFLDVLTGRTSIWYKHLADARI